MNPEISEFSYGFALTNELVGWAELKAAPIFPTLVEEGKVGGGYDVRLNYPAVALFLQFKRADYIERKNCKEISHHNLSLSVPFHRFAITERRRSFQHTSLVSLDDGINLVFYVAPRFHTFAEINAAWKAGTVAGESIYVAPSAIPDIPDDNSHHVSYDYKRAYFCSEPVELSYESIATLREKLRRRLNADKRPLRDQLAEWRKGLKEAADRASRRQREIEGQLAKSRRGRYSPPIDIDYVYGGLAAPYARELTEPLRPPDSPPPPRMDLRKGRVLYQPRMRLTL
jgi:hypothetical protein